MKFDTYVVLLTVAAHFGTLDAQQAERTEYSSERNANTGSTPNPTADGSLKRIVYWTKYHNQYRSLVDLASGKFCPMRCILTADRTNLQAFPKSKQSIAINLTKFDEKRQLHQVDHAGRFEEVENAAAVVFHWRDMLPYDLPQRRYSWQRYVYDNAESPLNTRDKYDVAEDTSWAWNFFNWTMTYRSDSDIPGMYGRLLKKGDETHSGYKPLVYDWNYVTDLVSKKDQLVFDLVSNCHSKSGREAVVEKLNKYIQVTARGNCSGAPCDGPCEQKLMASHKFYLAFENSICDEYVTEKLWRMKSIVVPVVLRASDAARFLPEGSFLAVDQFSSVEQLAYRMLDLNANDAEYLEFFKWTNEYQATAFDSDYKFCELCMKLYNDNTTKMYPDIQKWWRGSGNNTRCIPDPNSDDLSSSVDIVVVIFVVVVVVVAFIFHYCPHLRFIHTTKGRLARKYNAVSPTITTPKKNGITKCK